MLARDDTVLFIGSGVSLWSGLPSWPKLIEELAVYNEKNGNKAELIRREAQRGDLLQAASYGFDKLTKQQIGDFIRLACHYGVARPHEIHQKIVSLGPSCFITTNYDNLIEESLRLWRPDHFFRPVTNRNLTETAEIVHASAVNFVFKPHGDAADSDSIVLTREQYRQLLPDGERHAALESVKMLLASRPVVYIGFGLRDPDFIYLRDLLYNTYKGGTRDHFAIMADIQDAEVDYWKRNYGIQLVGYQTTEGPDGSHDHSPLLRLLDELLVTPAPHLKPDISTNGDSCSPELILALARHAGRLTRFIKSETEFPIRVHYEEKRTYLAPFSFEFIKFNHYPVERFLEDGPEHSLLIGLPGTGKTYSLKRAVACLGEKLNDACLNENFDEKSVIIPIFADMKLYQGNVLDLIDGTLPKGLSLGTLKDRFKLKIYIDSFNEMPREYWESAAYETDFGRFINSFENASIIISSRTNDGLRKLNFTSYCMDEIDESFVKVELQKRQLRVDGRFEREILALLKKPFYFHIYLNGSVVLPAEPHPKDIFQSFFKVLTAAFELRFGISFDLERFLSVVAYNAMNCGEETQPLTSVLQVLRNQLQGASIVNTAPSEVANWLVSKSVLIPYIGSRVAFFHQSVTEYLAASELARQYQSSPHILRKKLSLTRWDQALFLTLCLLPKDIEAMFLKSIVEADFVLALNASKYLETDRDEIVAKLLSEIPDRVKDYAPFDTKIVWTLRYGVPVKKVHEPQLRAIMACGNQIGGVAAELLVEVMGASIKDELLKSLYDCRNDYNYCCNGVAPAIRSFIETDDLGTLVVFADLIDEEVTFELDETIADGFICGVATLLDMVELDSIRTAFMPNQEISPVPEVRSRILCNVLQRRHSSDALELAAELLIRGVNKAATTLYFIINFAKPVDNLSMGVFNVSHVDRLVSMIQNGDKEAWALKALKLICASRHDLAEIVKSRALSANGLFRVALMYGAESKDKASIFDALSELAEMDYEQRQVEPIYLLKQIDFDWTGCEVLLIKFLRLRDVDLALTLIDNELEIGTLDIGPIEWWLEWLMNESGHGKAMWLYERISTLFAAHLKPEAHEAFVAEFNKSKSKFRGVLASSILVAFRELTTDKFSDDAISFLLASLRNKNATSNIRGHLLGNTATESFVIERLLPLLSGADETLAKNLHRVLLQAGSRHGRRYISA